MSRLSIALITIVALLVLLFSSIFTISEREMAIKLRLGEFKGVNFEPGVHVKIPFIDTIRKYDDRILTLDMEPERFLTLEKKNVVVDSFVKWRITDVAAYYKSTRGDESQASQRLAQVVKDGLRNEFGKRTIQEAISGERAEIMRIITQQFAEQAKQFGIGVVDVRIKRIELPAEVGSSVYQRMEAERARVAKDLRSKGAEAAERIRADADRQRTVIIAEATRDADRIRGEGDAKASEIYAKAFSRNEEFYRLYRSLNAYKNVFDKPQDVLVVDPNSEFFRYFRNSSGR